MSPIGNNGNKLKVAVIEGFHPFEIPQWHELFQSMEGMDCYLQSIDNWCVDCAGMREQFDVHLFYNMNMTLEEHPFKEQHMHALERLGETPQGIFMLHHAILAYPEYQPWSNIVGIKDRKFGFHPEQDLTVKVADTDHPISQGLADWDLHDETYTMDLPGEDSRTLFTTEHDPSMGALGWTHDYKQSRVFCFQPGHDHTAWENPTFREVIKRGINWCARKI